MTDTCNKLDGFINQLITGHLPVMTHDWELTNTPYRNGDDQEMVQKAFLPTSYEISAIEVEHGSRKGGTLR